MTTKDSFDSLDELRSELHNWATAVAGAKNAVDVLISSPWLTDAEFVNRCVVRVSSDPPLALVDWAAARVLLRDLSGRVDQADLEKLREALYRADSRDAKVVDDQRNLYVDTPTVVLLDTSEQQWEKGQALCPEYVFELLNRYLPCDGL